MEITIIINCVINNILLNKEKKTEKEQDLHRINFWNFGISTPHSGRKSAKAGQKSVG